MLGMCAFVQWRGVPMWASGCTAKGAHVGQRLGGGQCPCGAVVMWLRSARAGQWLGDVECLCRAVVCSGVPVWGSGMRLSARVGRSLRGGGVPMWGGCRAAKGAGAGQRPRGTAVGHGRETPRRGSWSETMGGGCTGQSIGANSVFVEDGQCAPGGCLNRPFEMYGR